MSKLKEWWQSLRRPSQSSDVHKPKNVVEKQDSVADEVEADSETDAVRIRIANVSDVPFEHVTWHSGEGQAEYDEVPSGAHTVYKVVPEAYRYGAVEVEVAGKTHEYQPIDYMGEVTLRPGDYTVAIDLENGRVRQELLTECTPVSIAMDK